MLLKYQLVIKIFGERLIKNQFIILNKLKKVYIKLLIYIVQQKSMILEFII